MPVTIQTIQFDTVEEAQRFLEGRDTGIINVTAPAEAPTRRRGRKPRGKVGRPPKKPGRPRKTAAKPAAKAKKPAGKVGRPRSAGTLTAKIQDTIKKFIEKKKEFSANDIYEDLVKREPRVKKQSVITSVLKQMKTTFPQVKVEERPGSGPRPVKVFTP